MHNECKSYAKLRAELKENGDTRQAHHVSQDAAFGKDIPKNEGMAVPLEGNVFTDPGSPHYNAHKTLEEFWDNYRKGGKYEGTYPTVGQYNKAAYDSLISAGFEKNEAADIIVSAYKQQRQKGYTNTSKIRKIPRKIYGMK